LQCATWQHAFHVKDTSASIGTHYDCRRVLLLFDFNGNFAKIAAIQKQGGPSAHFLFVGTL